jgi:hypothetical protein
MRVERGASGGCVAAVVRKFIVERSWWRARAVAVFVGTGWEMCFRLQDWVVRKGVLGGDVSGERLDKAVLIRAIKFDVFG